MKDLLFSQKNDVYIMIENSGLLPSNFKWSTVSSKQTPGEIINVLKYDETEYFFTFDFDKGLHFTVFSPGKKFQKEQKYPCGWDKMTE